MNRGRGITIELDAVSFSYGDRAVLSDISATITSGGLVCLLGPNGAGKTTLAQLIAGELTPARGRVHLDAEEDVGQLADVRRHIAYLPQDLLDPPFITVGELVSLGRFNPKGSLGWKLTEDDKKTVQECIARCHVESLAERPFAQLSGGEKQRAWLAFCLAQQREFLLLDESLHQMDFSMRELFFSMLSELANDGMGVILITHDLQMAMGHGHRMMVLQKGELVYDDRPDQAIYSLMS